MSILDMGKSGMPTDSAIMPADFASGSFEEMESFLAETLRNAPSVLVDEYETQEAEWILSKFQEIECLQAVLGEDFEVLDEHFFRIQILPPSLRNSSLKDPEDRPTPTSIWLCICTLASYPNCPPLVEIEDKSSLSRHDADALYVLLSREADARLGGPMLVDLALIAQQFVLDALDPQQKLTTDPPSQVEAVGADRAHVTAVANVAPDEASIADAALGVLDPTCFAPAHPSEYVGSLASVFAKMPPGYKVLRLETILRTDLAFRFESVRRLMAAAYAPAPDTHPKAVASSTATSKQGKKNQSKSAGAGAGAGASAGALGPTEAFVSWEPQLVFHGTRPNNVGNIVSRGLLVPNGASVVHVHDDGYYGRGVYTTPHASVALNYASVDDHHVQRMLVCAVLMGRARQCTQTMHGEPCTDGFNSHVSPGGHEWVVFKGAQLLPLYLLYISYGNPAGSSKVLSAEGHAGGRKGKFGFDMQTRMELTRGAAGETVEQRKVRAASRAAKMLPMGYGPAGARMEVLDCCDWSDDDEEDVGEYNEERYSDDWVRDLWEAQRAAAIS